MTSLDRLRQAIISGENGRSPVLPSETLKASLGGYGVSAAEQLLSSAGVGVEINSDGSSLEYITNPEIRAEFEKDLADYEALYAAAGITMPAVEQMEKAGISLTNLAELKEQHPEHELVFAPLIADIPTMRNIASVVTNNQSIPNNPLKKYSQTKADSDGLWIHKTVVDNWHTIMANTTRDYLASGMPTVSLNTGEIWTAYLMSSQNMPDNLNMSYRQMKQKGLTAITIPGYISYQMKRIQQGQKPIDTMTYTWALGEFTNSSGDACAPYVWAPYYGQIRVGGGWVDCSAAYLGVRSPVG